MGRVIAKSNIYPAIRHKLIQKVISYLYHNELASVHTSHSDNELVKLLPEMKGMDVRKTVQTWVFVGNKTDLYFWT